MSAIFHPSPLPCPKCGNPDINTETENRQSDGCYVTLHCTACGLQMSRFLAPGAFDALVVEWNTPQP